MRWQEILLLTESDPTQLVKDELSTMFGVLKVKNIDRIPLEKLLKQVSFDGLSVNMDDGGAIKNIIDIIASLDKLVDKVENNIVYLKSDKPVEYKPTDDKADKDKKAVSTDATKQAKKNIKK